MVLLLCLVLGLSDSTRNFVLNDIKGNKVYLNSLIEESNYTLIIDVYFKKSKDAKEVRLFVEESFAPQLENNSLSVYTLLDLSEYKNNQLVKNMVVSAVKRKNTDKPILIDFQGDFEKSFNVENNKKKIYCLLFDKQGNLKMDMHLDIDFGSNGKDTLYRTLTNVLKIQGDLLFHREDVTDWARLFSDLKEALEKDKKIPLKRLIRFSDSVFVNIVKSWNGVEINETKKNIFIDYLNSLVQNPEFFSKEYWPESLLNEDENRMIKKRNDMNREGIENLNFLLIKDILKPYKVSKEG